MGTSTRHGRVIIFDGVKCVKTCGEWLMLLFKKSILSQGFFLNYYYVHFICLFYISYGSSFLSYESCVFIKIVYGKMLRNHETRILKKAFDLRSIEKKILK